MTLTLPSTQSKVQQALYPYQRGDRDFMVSMPRSINGNPMGLGKTIEALATLEAINGRHNLIVCKKNFVPEWFNQIDTWLDGDCLTPHEGWGDRLDGLDLNGPRYLAINYDLLSIPRYNEQLRKVKWDAVVFDECHKIKNHEAKRTKYAYFLVRDIPYIYLMSGTPMQNSPLDLFPYFHIINRRDYDNIDDWKEYFCKQTEEEIWLKGKDGKARSRTIKRIIPGESNHTAELNFLLHKYMIRHEKSEVMPDLPPKQYRVVPVELGSEAKHYKEMEDDYFTILANGEEITAPRAIAQMMRLRQICLDPSLLSYENCKPLFPSAKTETLMEVVEDLSSKALIFSYFEQYTQIIAAELTKRKIPFVTITGKTPYTRQDHRFQEDPNIKVCLGTIGAMGESYTLTAADTVIFTDIFWNPAINEQCEDRVWGRVDKGLKINRGALIIDLQCEGTVEQYVHEVVRRKTEMINEVVVMRDVVELMRRHRGE